MTKFIEELAQRRRFGMRPSLAGITSLCAALGNPQRKLGTVIHVAGTNGKGAVCAMLYAALRGAFPHANVGCYISPHLVRINERFNANGHQVSDSALEKAASEVARAAATPAIGDITFFEALTAVAFKLFENFDFTVLETGLGGRLDATNVCDEKSKLCVITRIGLDHCDWLGKTEELIAAEKAGIIKAGSTVVLGENSSAVRQVIEARAATVGARLFYVPELVPETEVDACGAPPLPGKFNRENYRTAIAVLKVMNALMLPQTDADFFHRALTAMRADTVWPGRFQHCRGYILDGAHNPPGAKALAAALQAELGGKLHSIDLIAGFCGDKDVSEVLALLAPFIRRAWAVKTNNPRSLAAEETAQLMRKAGIEARAADSLPAALSATDNALICGSLFLVGEALVALDAYPWGEARFDPAELLKSEQ